LFPRFRDALKRSFGDESGGGESGDDSLLKDGIPVSVPDPKGNGQKIDRVRVIVIGGIPSPMTFWSLAS
jgi:hypothetical protein